MARSEDRDALSIIKVVHPIRDTDPRLLGAERSTLVGIRSQLMAEDLEVLLYEWEGEGAECYQVYGLGTSGYPLYVKLELRDYNNPELFKTEKARIEALLKKRKPKAQIKAVAEDASELVPEDEDEDEEGYTEESASAADAEVEIVYGS